VRARALAAKREATVVHVYNTARIPKRVHLYRQKQRLSRSTVCRVLPLKIGRRSHLAGLTRLNARCGEGEGKRGVWV
jgi:hypothetical protein